MTEDNFSLLDWVKLKWRDPLWQRTIRLLAAGVLSFAGALSLYLAPQTGNGLVLLAAAFILLILGLRIQVPEKPLPVFPREDVLEGQTADSIPEIVAAEKTEATAEPAAPRQKPSLAGILPIIRIPLAFGFALLAQFILDIHPNATDVDALLPQGGILYAVAFFFGVWGLLAGDFTVALRTADERPENGVTITRQRLILFAGAVIFGFLAYITLTGGMFHSISLILLFFSLFYWFLAAARYSGGAFSVFQDAAGAVAAWIRSAVGAIRRGFNVSPWSLLVIACFLALAVFRTYDMAGVPPVMTDDHAEKLVNVVDILEGRNYIFFANNGGRESLEFYLIALLTQVAGTGISFLSLKIVSVAGGIATLPFAYLLGKELADRRVGLLTMLLVGVGYWPDMISRIGLRFPLAMLFTTATLYFFLKALRRRRWNDFLWAGVLLGVGLYGYTPIRIVPVVLVLALVLFLLHPSSRGFRRWSVSGFTITMLTTGILAVPMVRYALEFPDDFWLRSMTRMIPEQSAVFDPVNAFVQNLRNGLLMFNWNDGGGWFNCVPLRPAFDVVTGALFSLGLVWVLVQFLRKRGWENLFLVLSLFILILPSVMALAEPVNNPSLTRASAAIPVAFLLPAFGLVAILDFLRGIIPGRAGVVGGTVLAIALMIPITVQNLDLTVVQFPKVYSGNSQNEDEVGAFMGNFAHSVGRYEDAYLIPYPYWVGDRGVNVYAGLPINASRVLWPKDIGSFVFSGRPTLFLLLAQDAETLQALQEKFPDASWKIVPSAYPDKEFIAFLVPGTPGEEAQP